MLRHASIGASGQALGDLISFAKHPAFDLVAVADVDLARFEEVQRRFPKVRVYQDWRELLDKELRRFGTTIQKVMKNGEMAKAAEHLGLHGYIQPCRHLIEE